MSDITLSWVSGAPRLAFSEDGRGAVVLFLHGIGGNRCNWAEQLPYFARAYHAVAWDARGYGDSEDYPGVLRFPDFAADLHRLLDHLGVNAAHLVGLSMGGRIALDFHAQAPQRVLSLALVDTFPGYDESFTPEAREEFIRLRQQPLLDGKEPRDIAPAVAKSLISTCAEPSHVQALIDSISALHKESYIKAIEAMIRYEPVADLSKVKVPTLVVVGDQDQLTPPTVARAMAAAISGAELVVLRNAGHLSNIEQPTLFNRVLGAFLDSLQARAGVAKDK